jgi:hypothetical protein
VSAAEDFAQYQLRFVDDIQSLGSDSSKLASAFSRVLLSLA